MKKPDDEEMILSVFGSMLNTLGYECALVQEGIEGSRQYMRADGHPFAAVLFDGTVPNAPAGKRSSSFFYKQTRRPRVILCNGYAESDLFKEAEQLGFRAFLAKPSACRNLSPS